MIFKLYRTLHILLISSHRRTRVFQLKGARWGGKFFSTPTFPFFPFSPSLSSGPKSAALYPNVEELNYFYCCCCCCCCLVHYWLCNLCWCLRGTVGSCKSARFLVLICCCSCFLLLLLQAESFSLPLWMMMMCVPTWRLLPTTTGRPVIAGGLLTLQADFSHKCSSSSSFPSIERFDGTRLSLLLLLLYRCWLPGR